MRIYNIRHYIAKAFSMPPNELAKKIVNKLDTKIRNKLQQSKDLSNSTRINFDVPLIKTGYIDINVLDLSNIDKKTAQYLSKMYCDHRFDLLGSGWVKNSYDSVALGVEGHRYEMNISTPKSIAADYEPIDWQKDFKSGYRWSEKAWYKNQPLGHKAGVDIKVPWELARLQHLPQLAIFSLIDGSVKEQYLYEFKYQVLDFIIHNPPRMGVNWVCTMDVAIRAANMLVAYDIFTQIDRLNILDESFKQTFANSIYEHGFHIVHNLEYSDWLTSNHYLSNIAGLVFIGSYLHSDQEINQWLAFGIQELINETQKQFYEDGGNFESSTCYHRLSAEMVLFTTSLILGLKSEKIESLKQYNPSSWKRNPKLFSPNHQQYIISETIQFPQWYIDRLYKIGRFTVDITKPDGEVAQFGDNDSGRFFRFSPNGEFMSNSQAIKRYLNLEGYLNDQELFWDENTLNHSTLISGFSGLFDDTIFQSTFGLEKSAIASLSKQKLKVYDDAYIIPIIDSHDNIELHYTQTLEYVSTNYLDAIHTHYYPQSGIYIFKNTLFHLAICATPLGQNDNGGHTHNDKLGFELYLNGISIIRDPGTYLYTPLPEKRNEFRSIQAHNIPIIKSEEQNTFDNLTGLFALQKKSKCSVLMVDSGRIGIMLEYSGICILRQFRITSTGLSITDRCNQKFTYNTYSFYSNGYGKIEQI